MYYQTNHYIYTQRTDWGLGETIGFIFPVYYNGLPRLVKRFVDGITILPGTYCFAIATSGGSRANSLGMLDDIITKNDVHLSYAEEMKMPSNYIVGHQLPSPSKVNKLLNAASEKAENAAKAISCGECKSVIRRAELWSRITNNYYLYKDINEWDNAFHTTDKCFGCGLCLGVCPVCNIEMKDERPTWKNNCERCLACLHGCPFEAIEYGKKTVGRSRYHNPNIKTEDIKRA